MIVLHELQENNKTWEQFLIDSGFVEKVNAENIISLSSEEKTR
jgi:hypothetical protein